MFLTRFINSAAPFLLPFSTLPRPSFFPCILESESMRSASTCCVLHSRQWVAQFIEHLAHIHCCFSTRFTKEYVQLFCLFFSFLGWNCSFFSQINLISNHQNNNITPSYCSSVRNPGLHIREWSLVFNEIEAYWWYHTPQLQHKNP